ncbi:MAG TPA: SDR family NAD(P)-dependent oxidoreductase [bacterium]|nr:SDR family NAD(P)-dependent oxidoreductase [bacterium]
MELLDRVAIITGSGSGIGKAIALAFAQAGAKIALCDINDEALAKTGESVGALGAEALPVRVDVTDPMQVNRMVEVVVGAWGRVDILVNNAGGGGGQSGLEMTDEEWDSVVDLNLKSQFLCCRAVVPQMERQGFGRIINMASNAGKYRSNTGIGGIHYGAAKAGVMQLTRVAAYVLGRKGITVNAIAPGSVLSEAGVREYESLAVDRRERILKETPLGRFASPEEIAGIAVFLASDDSSYVTGATILASGGWCST